LFQQNLRNYIRQKDFGQYGEDGVMKVCFLTDHDITGGNSGSPVINGNGELIGLAFDGNWEAMSGDIAFEPELQRTINVDVRYVMFIIDKFAGATNLIEEMTLVTEKPVTVIEVDDVEPIAEVENCKIILNKNPYTKADPPKADWLLYFCRKITDSIMYNIIQHSHSGIMWLAVIMLILSVLFSFIKIIKKMTLSLQDCLNYII